MKKRSAFGDAMKKLLNQPEVSKDEAFAATAPWGSSRKERDQLRLLEQRMARTRKLAAA